MINKFLGFSKKLVFWGLDLLRLLVSLQSSWAGISFNVNCFFSQRQWCSSVVGLQIFYQER